MGIKRGKTKRPDIITCLSFKYTHTTKIRQAPFRGNISGRNNYSILIAAGVVAQQGNRRYKAMKENCYGAAGGTDSIEQFTKSWDCSTWKEACIF